MTSIGTSGRGVLLESPDGFLAAIALASIVLAGCGGSEMATNSQTTDGGREGAVDGAPPASDGGDGAVAATSACPAAMPAAGASCTANQLACEYGTDPAIECDTIVTCSGGAWTVTQTPFAGPFCSTTANNPSCPASLAGVMLGTSCGSTFFECDFPQARCECRCPGAGNGMQCGPGMPEAGTMTWQCDSSTTAGCPAVRPRLGAACSVPPTFCLYTGSDNGACWGDAISCKDGVWVNVGGAGC